MRLNLILFLLGFALLIITASITLIRVIKTKAPAYRIVMALYLVLMAIGVKLLNSIHLL